MNKRVLKMASVLAAVVFLSVPITANMSEEIPETAILREHSYAVNTRTGEKLYRKEKVIKIPNPKTWKARNALYGSYYLILNSNGSVGMDRVDRDEYIVLGRVVTYSTDGPFKPAGFSWLHRLRFFYRNRYIFKVYYPPGETSPALFEWTTNYWWSRPDKSYIANWFSALVLEDGRVFAGKTTHQNKCSQMNIEPVFKKGRLVGVQFLLYHKTQLQSSRFFPINIQ